MKKKKKKHKKKSCVSKVGYKTIHGARRAIKSMNKKNFIFHELEVYHCKYCKMWHIGRTKRICYEKFDELTNGK